MNCTKLDTVKISESILYIGINSFSYCSKLRRILFSESSKLKLINERAFFHCISLETITLPQQLREILTSAFEGCIKLKLLIILSNISKIGRLAFLNCKNLENITYLGSTEPNVDMFAFSRCKRLGVVFTKSTYLSKNFGHYRTVKLSALKSKTNLFKLISFPGIIKIIYICIAAIILIWLIYICVFFNM